MVRLQRGSVTAITERADGLVRLLVDGEPCIAYPRLTGPVCLADDVLVNTEARELGLGSGGFDILHANLTRGLRLASEPGAHVMKLPYTPMQVATLHREEHGEPPAGLDGLPVVACTLHSQLAPVCAGIGSQRRTAYVQLAGGALPVSLSDSVRALRHRGLIELTVGVGPCLDGDLACVTAASALLNLAADGFEVVVCGIGPGIVGTATGLGHGGLSAAEALSAAALLGGRPILVPRVSSEDRRDRHRGLSHHTRGVLSVCPAGVEIAWPAELPEAPRLSGLTRIDTAGWQSACDGLALSTMGRGPDAEPWFFAAAYAAGRIAAAAALARLRSS